MKWTRFSLNVCRFNHSRRLRHLRFLLETTNVRRKTLDDCVAKAFWAKINKSRNRRESQKCAEQSQDFPRKLQRFCSKRPAFLCKPFVFGTNGEGFCGECESAGKRRKAGYGVLGGLPQPLRSLPRNRRGRGFLNSLPLGRVGVGLPYPRKNATSFRTASPR